MFATISNCDHFLARISVVPGSSRNQSSFELKNFRNLVFDSANLAQAYTIFALAHHVLVEISCCFGVILKEPRGEGQTCHETNGTLKLLSYIIRLMTMGNIVSQTANSEI